MLKEAYEDLKRGQRDKLLNEKLYKRLDCHSGIIRDVKAQDIRVGDIIQVNSDERIPADLVCLFTTDKSGAAYIRTDQLDGETDWKVRRSVVGIQNEMFDYKDIGNFYHCEVKCEEPSNKIYDFNGTFLYPHHPGDAVQRDIQEALSLENTMWANTVLASQGFILGLVVYTGRETRSQMNQKKPRSKMCLLDIEVNRLSKVLFTLMIVLAGVITTSNGLHGEFMLFFMRCVLLLSSIIPISLRVNLDLAKLYYSYMINVDDSIEGSIARNSNIPEDLGRLSYLITDKTGTLTQNEMLLKKLCTEHAIFEADDSENELEAMLKENCEKFPQGPINDIGAVQIDNSQVNKKKKKRDQGSNLRDLVTAFAICNNVTPVADDPEISRALEVFEGDEAGRASMKLARRSAVLEEQIPASPLGRATYQPRKEKTEERISGRPAQAVSRTILQASSPDEVALVKYSNKVGIELVERDRTFVQLRNAHGIYENYDILANFPFSS